ncbi:Heterokaryon incompatibility protein (HET) domain containing protein [Naviculisporaceae sp. PSN 640]
MSIPDEESLTSADHTELLQTPRNRHHTLILEHQHNELKYPGVSIHSCSYCKHIAISTAAETEGKPQVMRWVRCGVDGPDGEQSVLTSGWAREAAIKGCDLFMSLLGATAYNPLSTQPNNVLHFEFHSQENQSAFTVLERTLDSDTVRVSNILEIYELYAIPRTGETDQPSNDPERVLPPNIVPASYLSYTRARLWLSDCQESHTQCAKFNLTYMPTRVLEVVPDSSLPKPGNFTVRLLEHPELAPYATLSYCWGGEQSFKTTQAHVERYKRDIQLTELAQTITDALTVVYSVGFKYIWVDALCIIQDDEEDKLREITNMHRIYRGSFFTIAAAVAHSSQDGFLQLRTSYKGFKIETQSADGVSQDLLAVRLIDRSDVTTYPLYKRAWTYQEDSLSTRILAYGNRGLVYKCLESSHSDGGHAKCSIWRRGFESSPGMLLNHLRPGGQQLKSVDHPQAWGNVFNDYTNRLLSFADDKLLAIAALAEEYTRTQPVTVYLAGLWKEDLLYQCLWQRLRPIPKDKPGVTRPKRYRAPSWSWASLDGSFHSLNVEHMMGWRDGARPTFSCHLLEAQTTLADENNPFGQVTGGILRIYGRMRRLVWVSPPHTHDGVRDGYALDGYGWAYGNENSDKNDKSKADTRLDFIVDDLREWPENTKITMWCMEFCTFVAPDNILLLARAQFSEERGSRMILEGRGLLLLPIVEEDPLTTPTTFRRVGMVSFKGLPKEDPYFERQRYWFDDGDSQWRGISII